jgi:ribosome-binding protein aMBF1 (putative translation factor)
MGEEKKLSSDAFEWAYNEFVAGDPESEALFKEYEVKADIAQQVYDLRNQADLTRAGLAELVGIAESIIRDLEEADYEGDSLGMLVRIGSALNRKIEIRFVPTISGESSEFQTRHT